MRFDVALIILYNPQRKILLQHRSSDAEVLPDYWAFFGGRIEEAETPEEAVRRETFEELNYRLKSPSLTLKKNFRQGKDTGCLYVYTEYFKKNPAILDVREGQGFGWYDVPQIGKLRITRRDKQIIKFVFNYLKRRDIYDAQAHKKKTSNKRA